MFNYRMSYAELSTALNNVAAEHRLLTPHEVTCIERSLEHPFLTAILKKYPLLQSAQKLLQDALTQNNVQGNRENVELLQHVHDVAFSGPRASTALYLQKYLRAGRRSDLMEKLESFVGEALDNADVLKEIEIAEKERYRLREIECKAGRLSYCSPVQPTQVIITEFKERYIPHLKAQYNAKTTFVWDILSALFNRIESLQTSAEKDEARNALILALDDARAAYDLNEYKYFLGIDFSCLHGLEERLLDHHQLIVPHAQSSLSSIKDTVKSLISPFAKMDSQDIEHGGITRHIYTPLLYQLYAQAAGYRLGPQTKQIYKFKDSVNIENIKQQYLNQFSNVRLRERQEKIFNAAIASMENNSLTVGEDDHNSLIIFFNEKGLLEQREHTQDELIAPESLRTEEEILATMVAEGPFIDRAHLETVLAWHDLNASTETMRNSLLAGLEPSFKEVSPFKESMVMRYNLYVQNQLNRNRYLQFYFMHNDLDTIISWREMRDLPCFQTVLCEYLSKNQIRKTLQKKQLAVFCIKNGYYKALKILLAQGVNPNYEHPYERNTLLSMAIKENHKACIKVLIEAGAKLDFQSWHRPTALMEAAVGGKIESLKFLIEAGAKLDLADQYGDTALIRTVRYRALESMKVLIDAGANIDICGASQCTALMWAARNNHVQSVKLLIQSGANLDVQDCKGNTALMLASLHGGVECIKLLIDAGANLDLKDRDQNTPMMNALKNLEISKIWTLSKGLAGRYFDNFINGILESKIQLQISQNEPDLIRAAKEGDRFTCWRLLQNGTNINRCDKNGHTALDVAIANEHVDLIKELMCYEMNPYHLIQSIRFAVENPKYHHTVSLLFTPKIIEIMLRQQPDAVAWAQKHQCDAAIVALSSGNICIDLNNPFISEESKLVNFKQPLLHSRNLSATQQNRYTHQRP